MKNNAPPFRYNEAKIIVDHAVRWAQNILVEVLANHGEFINDEAREILRDITTKINQIHGKL